MSKRFSGKNAIVTGAAMGIGQAIARRLGSEGAAVALVDSNQMQLENATSECLALGIDAFACRADVSRESDVASAFELIAQKWPTVDILVHAAGIVGPTSTKITEYSVQDFDRTYEVNLRGTFLITKFTLQMMGKTNAGRILLIASIAGKEGNPGMVGYSSSKAGVIGLVKGVAKEFATTKITINGLAPAVISTPMNDQTSAEQLRYMIAKIPMQRTGTVDEVASMAAFIVSDENSFSTGFIFDISGGRATY